MRGFAEASSHADCGGVLFPVTQVAREIIKANGFADGDPPKIQVVTGKLEDIERLPFEQARGAFSALPLEELRHGPSGQPLTPK